MTKKDWEGKKFQFSEIKIMYNFFFHTKMRTAVLFVESPWDFYRTQQFSFVIHLFNYFFPKLWNVYEGFIFFKFFAQSSILIDQLKENENDFFCECQVTQQINRVPSTTQSFFFYFLYRLCKC